MISRREIIGIVASVATLALFAAPHAALAQAPVKAARIGVLLPTTPAAAAHLLDGLRQGLRDHGYVENQNLVLERRYGEGRIERLAVLADELVELKVDVIVVGTDAGVHAVRNATQRIPIVMANSTDPVGTDFVASLARPGGNVTGLTFMAPEIVGKRLELLKEIVPGLARVAFLWTPEFSGNALELQEIQVAGRALRVDIHPVAVLQSAGVESGLFAATSARVDALVLAGPNPTLFVNRIRIVEFAAQHRLPTMSQVREYVDEGGLIAYGASNADMFRRAAGYVDKILKGAKPADLPVEQPTRFELVVNLKTAKALGITIPQSILLRADEVIE